MGKLSNSAFIWADQFYANQRNIRTLIVIKIIHHLDF